MGDPFLTLFLKRGKSALREKRGRRKKPRSQKNSTFFSPGGKSGAKKTARFFSPGGKSGAKKTARFFLPDGKATCFSLRYLLFPPLPAFTSATCFFLWVFFGRVVRSPFTR